MFQDAFIDAKVDIEKDTSISYYKEQFFSNFAEILRGFLQYLSNKSNLVEP